MVVQNIFITIYPKFKSKKSRSSYRTNNITHEYKEKIYNSIEINLKDNIIKLPKLKEIKIRGYRNLDKIEGRIINATIYKEASKYYVSLCVEQYKEIKEVPIRNVIGIDLGVKDLLATSDGIIIKNMKFIYKYEKKLKGLNRYLQEKGISQQYTGKICTVTNTYCSDKVNRTTNWTGLVGLMSVSDRMLNECVFADVTFIGPFDNCTITNSSFKGSKGAVININTINGRVGDKADLTYASFKLGFPKTNGDEEYQRRR